MAEAEANAVSDETTNEPPVTQGKGTTDLEGQVGEGNRVETEEVPRGSDAETRQRVEDTGLTPSSENAQATLKAGTPAEEGSLASAVETAVGDETPTTDVTTPLDTEGPGVDSVDDVDVPEVLSKPAGEVVDEALGSEDDGPSADTELGKAAADVDDEVDNS